MAFCANLRFGVLKLRAREFWAALFMYRLHGNRSVGRAPRGLPLKQLEPPLEVEWFQVTTPNLSLLTLTHLGKGTVIYQTRVNWKK